MSNEVILTVILAGIGIIVTILIKTNSVKISQKTKKGHNTMNNNTIGNSFDKDKNSNKKKGWNKEAYEWKSQYSL